MARTLIKERPMLHFLIFAFILCAAVMLTIANVSTPVTGIPMFHVYTFNSTPSQDNIWADFGLYGYCTWAPYEIDNSSILYRYCSSFEVGYDPVTILNYATSEPRDLFSASEANRLRVLAKPLIIHLIAAVFAWATLATVILYIRIGTRSEFIGTLLTCILTIIGLGLDTALFVPMKHAISSYSDYSGLSHAYWLVVASAISTVLALMLVAYEHFSMRSYERNTVTYRKVEEGIAPVEISLEPRKNW